MTILQKIRKFWSALWLPALSIVLTCLYPCAFLYAHNVEEAPVSSMFPFFGLFLLNALAVWLVLMAILRWPSAAGFLTDLVMLVVINFSAMLGGLRDLIPSLPAEVLLAVFGVLLVGILVLLLVKKPVMRIPCVLVSLAFGVLTLGCFVTATVFSLSKGTPKVDGSEPFASYEPMTFQRGQRPNVYFFLYDGYGGVENLQHYYDYDNEPFMKELEDRGFSVSRTSHNTESLKTVTIVPNLMNLNYVIHGDMTTGERNAFLVMPNLFRTFADNGYQLNLINHLNYFGAEGCHVLTHKQSPQTISDFLLATSVYSQSGEIKKELNRFIKADYVENYTGPLFDALEAEKTCWQDVGDGPTFTLGYIQSPHAPTILDKNGNLVDNYTHVGWQWDRHELYLGQLEFISSEILEIVDNIQEHDPNAMIIIQSDHGSRQANHYYNMGIWDTFDPKVENLFMQNTLNCVYYQGERFSIEGLTGINTIRTILNQVYGTDYEMIEPKIYSKGTFEK